METPRDTDNTDSANPNVEITIHNTLNTNKALYIYLTGLPNIDGSDPTNSDSNYSQAILKTDGTWDMLDANGSEIPINITANVGFRIAPSNGSTTTITLPSFVTAARLYVFEGAEMQWQMVSAATGGTSIVQPVTTTPGTTAHDNRWGFVEFTSSGEQFFVNLSFVDFVSLGMGISVVDDDTGVKYIVPGLSSTLKALESGGRQYVSNSSVPSNGTTTLNSTMPNLVKRPGTQSRFSNATAAIQRTNDVLESICADLRAQSQKDGNAWDKLCIYSSPSANSTQPKSLLRILSPQDGLGQDIPFTNTSYYDAYISRVWSHYTTTITNSSSNLTTTVNNNNNNILYIDTQNPDITGTNTTLVPCSVCPATDSLLCTGSTIPMPRPTTADIWGCNTGAFAINKDNQDDAIFKAVVPRVCAAFARSTLLLMDDESQNGSEEIQPGPANSTFYKAEVTNHYARIIHQYEGVGGYAFPYDDVGVEGENQEGAIQVRSARRLDVYVG